MSTYAYRTDQELPTMRLSWEDGDGTLMQFATGWTATVKVAKATTPSTTVLTKTVGITLGNTAPNYVIDWAIADWTTILAAVTTIGPMGTLFVVHAYARRTGDTKDDVFRPDNLPEFKLLPAAS